MGHTPDLDISMKDLHSNRSAAEETIENTFKDNVEQLNGDNLSLNAETEAPSLQVEAGASQTHQLSTPVKKHTSPSINYSKSAKRQRLQNASTAMNTLSKPFKSPLIIRRSDDSSSTLPKVPPPQFYTPTTVSQSQINSLASALDRGKVSNDRMPVNTPQRQKSHDPEITALSAQVIQLRNRLKAATTRLATSEQALALESLPATHKDSDEYLEEVIAKWRGAARHAADYLFGVAGDRVNMMGGPKAYFDRERERRSNWESDSNTPATSGWGEGREDEDEDQEAREERKRQLMDEYDIDAHEEVHAQQDEVGIMKVNDNSFTMDMMLKTMNIDLNLIGFDTDRQCWRD